MLHSLTKWALAPRVQCHWPSSCLSTIALTYWHNSFVSEALTCVSFGRWSPLLLPSLLPLSQRPSVSKSPIGIAQHTFSIAKLPISQVRTIYFPTAMATAHSQRPSTTFDLQPHVHITATVTAPHTRPRNTQDTLDRKSTCFMGDSRTFWSHQHSFTSTVQ